jgi:hypothetical protein
MAYTRNLPLHGGAARPRRRPRVVRNPLGGSWDWWESEPEKIIDRGDGTIIIHAVTRGRGVASGVDVELRDTDVYEIDQGWAVRVREVEESVLQTGA